MQQHSLTRGFRRTRITVFLFSLSLVCSCFKSEKTTSRDVQTSSPLALTTPLPVATPNRQTAAERIVEIDRLLAMPLTGTPEESDGRTFLRAERAALISSGQVSYQSGNQAALTPAQPVASSQATMVQHSANGDVVNYAPPTTNSQNGQIVIAPNSQASSLPFLEQLTPTERTHYFQALRLQNRSVFDVNVRHHTTRGRRWSAWGRLD